MIVYRTDGYTVVPVLCDKCGRMFICEPYTIVYKKIIFLFYIVVITYIRRLINE